MYYALWSLQRRFSLPRDRRRHDSQLDAALERFRRAAGERDALFGQVEELKAQLGALQVELGEAGVRLEDAALGVYAIKPQTLKGLTEKLDFHADVTTKRRLRRSADGVSNQRPRQCVGLPRCSSTGRQPALTSAFAISTAAILASSNDDKVRSRPSSLSV